jgi:hypothetical protein
MEPRLDLDGIEKYKPDLNANPIEYFDKALAFARQFYGEQMKEIASVKLEHIDPDFFFRELIWVVHATGFSAKAVGNFMPKLSRSYGFWNNLGVESFNKMFARVKLVCNNPAKAKAVYDTAVLMVQEIVPDDRDEVKWAAFKQKYLSTPEKLRKLPYIGKITCYHLGRNIGLLDCVKPDLHLVRMAEHWGYADCTKMCQAFQEHLEQTSGEKLPLGIIDYVLWIGASTFGTLSVRQEGKR